MVRLNHEYRVNCAWVLSQPGADRCTWCKRPISRALPVGHPRKATCDHVRPRAKGGTHAIANLVPCCFECNNRRRDKSPNTVLPPGERRSRNW